MIHSGAGETRPFLFFNWPTKGGKLAGKRMTRAARIRRAKKAAAASSKVRSAKAKARKGAK